MLWISQLMLCWTPQHFWKQTNYHKVISPNQWGYFDCPGNSGLPLGLILKKKKKKNQLLCCDWTVPGCSCSCFYLDSRLNVIFSKFDEVQRSGNMVLSPMSGKVSKHSMYATEISHRGLWFPSQKWFAFIFFLTCDINPSSCSKVCFEKILTSQFDGEMKLREFPFPFWWWYSLVSLKSGRWLCSLSVSQKRNLTRFHCAVADERRLHRSCCGARWRCSVIECAGWLFDSV